MKKSVRKCHGVPVGGERLIKNRIHEPPKLAYYGPAASAWWRVSSWSLAQEASGEAAHPFTCTFTNQLTSECSLEGGSCWFLGIGTIWNHFSQASGFPATPSWFFHTHTSSTSWKHYRKVCIFSTFFPLWKTRNIIKISCLFTITHNKKNLECTFEDT